MLGPPGGKAGLMKNCKSASTLPWAPPAQRMAGTVTWMGGDGRPNADRLRERETHCWAESPEKVSMVRNKGWNGPWGWGPAPTAYNRWARL